jgi:hypothetical protein
MRPRHSVEIRSFSFAKAKSFFGKQQCSAIAIHRRWLTQFVEAVMVGRRAVVIAGGVRQDRITGLVAVVLYETDN